MRGGGWVRYPFPFLPLLPAVFLTGATGLAYEIVWTRRLSLLLGSTSGAVAAVLSSFMLGMALGALLVGRRADRSRRPLRWYGVMEIGIGVYALVFPAVAGFLGSSFSGIPWLGAFLLLALPAALMGGTLPVLARATADTAEQGARHLGVLFGVNTLGAVAGALLTVFFLLERFGLSGAAQAAAVVNIFVGAVFWLLSARAGEREIFEIAPEEQEDAKFLGGADLRTVFAFFLAGFAGLALEVAWIRLLVYFLEGFTIAFGLMLSTYLLGLALGAVGGSWLSARSRNPRRLLASLLLVEALAVIGAALLSGGIEGPLEAARRAQAQVDTIGFAYAAALFSASAKVILPGTLLAGALLPAAARIAMAGRHRIGAHGGGIYAASTFGSVLAPPAAAFLLIPALGVPGTVVACGALLLLAGTLATLGTGMRGMVTAAGAAALFVVVCLAGDQGRPLLERTRVLSNERFPRRLLAAKDGPLAGVAVVEDLDSGARSLYLDGFRAAETGRPYGYMRMLAHLPMLLHPGPKEICVIAFGTGTTAGAASVHPGVTRLVCVDNEPEVFGMAGHFSAVNRDVLSKPFAERVVADGREYVGRPGQRFDVITLEPLLPNMPGAVYLYTREFYRAARGSLAREGFLCQWIPIHVLANDDFRRLVAAMTAEFEHVSLWYFDQSALLVGGTAPPKVTPGETATRASVEEIALDLRLARVGDVAQLFGSHVASDEALRKGLQGAEPLEDDRTVVEFRPLPRGFADRTRRYRIENLRWFRDLHEKSVPWLRGEAPGVEAALRIGRATLACLASRGEERSELLDLVRDSPSALHGRYVLQSILYEELLAEGRAAEAARLDLVPDRSRAFLALALLPGTPAEERKRHLFAAVRENHVLSQGIPRDEAVRLLREAAQSLEDPREKRFCANRVAALEGRPFEAGEERPPELRLPDLLPLLREGDGKGAREALEEARLAGKGEEAEEAARRFLDESRDPVEAARLLHEADSKHALRAALKLSGSPKEEDRIAAARILCARSLPAWEKLCSDPSTRVRDEAAGFAGETGGRAHLRKLAQLLSDESEEVRLSAFASFLRIEPEAEKCGFDHRAPSAESLEALRKLAGP